MKQGKTVLKTALLCTVTAAVLSAAACSPATVRERTVSLAFTDQLDESQAYLVRDDKLVVVGIEDSNGSFQTAESMDGKTLAFRNDSALFVTDGSACTRVADDVSFFTLSAQGTAIAYTTDENPTLFLYDIRKNSKTEIDTFSDEYPSPCVLSPDGSALLYNKTDGDSQELWLYTEKKKTRLKSGDYGYGPYPIAVSANGKICYAATMNGLYSFDADENENKLAAWKGLSITPKFNMNYFDWNFFQCYLNADCTDLLFHCDGNTYLSEDGSEKNKLSGTTYDPILTDAEMARPFKTGICEFEDRASIGGFRVNLTSVRCFTDRFYESENAVAYVDKNYELDKISGDVESSAADSRGDAVYYIKNDALYHAAKSNRGNPEKLADDVAEFVVGTEKKEVYFIDTDDTLKYYNGKKTEKIADDVAEVCFFAPYGGVIYETEDDMLYFSKKTSRKKITGVVSDWEVRGNVAYYLTDRDSDSKLYGSTGGDFKLLLKECRGATVFSD